MERQLSFFPIHGDDYPENMIRSVMTYDMQKYHIKKVIKKYTGEKFTAETIEDITKMITKFYDFDIFQLSEVKESISSEQKAEIELELFTVTEDDIYEYILLTEGIAKEDLNYSGFQKEKAAFIYEYENNNLMTAI